MKRAVLIPLLLCLSPAFASECEEDMARLVLAVKQVDGPPREITRDERSRLGTEYFAPTGPFTNPILPWAVAHLANENELHRDPEIAAKQVLALIGQTHRMDEVQKGFAVRFNDAIRDKHLEARHFLEEILPVYREFAVADQRFRSSSSAFARVSNKAEADKAKARLDEFLAPQTAMQKAMDLARVDHAKREEERTQNAKTKYEQKRLLVEKYFGENGAFREPILGAMVASLSTGEDNRNWNPSKRPSAVVFEQIREFFEPLSGEMNTPEDGTRFMRQRDFLKNKHKIDDALIESGIRFYNSVFSKGNEREALHFFESIYRVFEPWAEATWPAFVPRQIKYIDGYGPRRKPILNKTIAEQALTKALHDQPEIEASKFPFAHLAISGSIDVGTKSESLSLPALASAKQAALPAPVKPKPPVPVHYTPMPLEIAQRKFDVAPSVGSAVFALELDEQLGKMARGFAESRSHADVRESWKDVHTALSRILPRWRKPASRLDALRHLTPALMDRAQGYKPLFEELTTLGKDAATLKGAYERAIETLAKRRDDLLDRNDESVTPEIVSHERRRTGLERSLGTLEAMEHGLQTSHERAETMVESLLELQTLLNSSQDPKLSEQELSMLRSLKAAIESLPKGGRK